LHRNYRSCSISFALTKLASLLVYPLTQSLLLSLLALLCFRWRRLAAGLVMLSVGWLYLASTGLFADFLMGSLEDHYPPKAMAAVPAADAIVVLGGATRGDAHFSRIGDLNEASDRIVHGLALYKAGKAPMILLSGGSHPGQRPEAELMYEHLELMGMPPDAMLRERQSRDTHQNALYSAILLKGKGMRRIHLVTSAFHMRRSVPLFEAQGLEVIPAPTDFQRLIGEPPVPRWLPTARDLLRTTYALKEYVGFLIYQYRGWI
jgi:uncharacterized SAM-binding protein YcdF (DUF218 family)